MREANLIFAIATGVMCGVVVVRGVLLITVIIVLLAETLNKPVGRGLELFVAEFGRASLALELAGEEAACGAARCAFEPRLFVSLWRVYHVLHGFQ